MLMRGSLLLCWARARLSLVFHSWVCLICMLIFIFSQLYFMAQALSCYDSLYCVPVFQCFFIFVSAMGGQRARSHTHTAAEAARARGPRVGIRGERSGSDSLFLCVLFCALLCSVPSCSPFASPFGLGLQAPPTFVRFTISRSFNRSCFPWVLQSHWEAWRS